MFMILSGNFSREIRRNFTIHPGSNAVSSLTLQMTSNRYLIIDRTHAKKKKDLSKVNFLFDDHISAYYKKNKVCSYVYNLLYFVNKENFFRSEKEIELDKLISWIFLLMRKTNQLIVWQNIDVHLCYLDESNFVRSSHADKSGDE